MSEDYFSILFDDAIGQRRLAGANVLLIKNGSEVFSGSYGMADIERGIPMRRDAVFRMFSMSKPVTAAAVMILVDRGIIDLMDSVDKYLPGFRNGQVAVMDEPVAGGDARGLKYHLEPVPRPVTLQDLMTMTSGVCYPGIESAAHIEVARRFDEWLAQARPGDYSGTVAFANVIGSCPLAFRPGERWMYGFSADILGAVVEVATGMRFGDFLRDEIFTPLGMLSTGFTMTKDMRERLAQTYEDDPAGGIRPFTGSNLGLGDYPDSPLFESGGAGLLSTIDDYARFAMMLAGEGWYNGRRLLSPNAVRFMRTNQLSPEIRERDMNWYSTVGHGYGSLMRVLEKPEVQATTAPAGEYGWDGWMGTYFVIEPASRSVILYLKQKTNAGFDDITRRVRAIAYGQYL